MATMGIRIVHAGNNSLPGHMYVVFKGDDGSVTTFGHFPTTMLNGIGGPGGVRDDDKANHETKVGAPGTNGVPNVSRDFYLSPADFQKALAYAQNAASQAGDPKKTWGAYDPLYRSCVDFTWNVMREAGLNQSSWFEGYALPSWNKNPLSDAYFEFFRRPEFNREFKAVISSVIGTTPDPLVKTIKYVPWSDPLVLDLDGDGLEIRPLSAGVLFDTNGDTIKTGTAWVGADDGILVRDINGNGLIDSGRELFGDETILTTGPNAGSKASHGFTALADLNSNGDAVFNARDAQFANLRVWKDLNQDGVSQAGGLQSFAAANIQNINLAIVVGSNSEIFRQAA